MKPEEMKEHLNENVLILLKDGKKVSGVLKRVNKRDLRVCEDESGEDALVSLHLVKTIKVSDEIAEE